MIGQVKDEELPEGLVGGLVFKRLGEVCSFEVLPAGVAEFALDLRHKALCTIECGDDICSTASS